MPRKKTIVSVQIEHPYKKADGFDAVNSYGAVQQIPSAIVYALTLRDLTSKALPEKVHIDWKNIRRVRIEIEMRQPTPRRRP